MEKNDFLIKHRVSAEQWDVIISLIQSKIAKRNDADKILLAIGEIIPSEEINFAAMGIAAKDKREAAVEKKYWEVFYQLVAAYIKEKNKSQREQELQKIWKEASENFNKSSNAQLYNVSNNRAIKSYSAEEREKLKQKATTNKGHWLNEVDVEDIANLMGLKDRLGTFPLILNNERNFSIQSIGSHLEFKLKQCPYVGYLMLSVSNKGEAQGCHWIPVKISIDSSKNIEMEVVLGRGQHEYSKQVENLLFDAAQSTEQFHNIDTNSSFTSTQKDNWSCGYRALWEIAQWEGKNRHNKSAYLKKLKDIQNNNEEEFNLTLNNSIFNAISENVPVPKHPMIQNATQIIPVEKSVPVSPAIEELKKTVVEKKSEGKTVSIKAPAAAWALDEQKRQDLIASFVQIGFKKQSVDIVKAQKPGAHQVTLEKKNIMEVSNKGISTNSSWREAFAAEESNVALEKMARAMLQTFKMTLTDESSKIVYLSGKDEELCQIIRQLAKEPIFDLEVKDLPEEKTSPTPIQPAYAHNKEKEEDSSEKLMQSRSLGTAQ